MHPCELARAFDLFDKPFVSDEYFWSSLPGIKKISAIPRKYISQCSRWKIAVTNSQSENIGIPVRVASKVRNSQVSMHFPVALFRWRRTMGEAAAEARKRSAPGNVHIETANYRSNIRDSRIREFRISELHFVIAPHRAARLSIVDRIVYELVMWTVARNHRVYSLFHQICNDGACTLFVICPWQIKLLKYAPGRDQWSGRKKQAGEKN